MEPKEMITDLTRIFDACLKAGMFQTVADAEKLVLLRNALFQLLTNKADEIRSNQ